MFIVAQVYAVGPSVGTQYVRETWEEAVDIAVKMACEQLTQDGDPDEATIRREVEETGGYEDNNGEWAVCIGQPNT